MAYFWSKNPITRNIDADGAAAVKLDIWIESGHDAGDYAAVISLQLTPDLLGFCRFRIESVLDSLLEEAQQKEELDLAADFTRSLATIRNFYTVATRLDEASEVISIATSDEDTVILGSTSFLSNSGPSSPMSLDSRQYPMVIREGLLFLTTLCGFEGDATRIRYIFKKIEDDSERVVETVYSGGEYTGITHIRLAEFPADDEKPEYEVTIASGSEVLLGPYTFTLDRDYAPVERTFLFRNCRGGWETLVATGIGRKKVEVDRMIANRIMRQTDIAIDKDHGLQFVYRSESTLLHTVNSGWLPSREQASWLIWELLSSPEVYEIIYGTFNTRVPVVIATKSAQTEEDENYLTALSFDYSYALPNLSPRI